MDQRISEVISQVVSEGTFTPVALAQMETALKKVVDLEKDLLAADTLAADLRRELDTQNSTIAQLRAGIAKHAERDTDLAKRETEITNLEKQAATATAQLAGYKEALETIMRPAAVRTETQRNAVLPGTPSANPNEYTNLATTTLVTDIEVQSQE